MAARDTHAVAAPIPQDATARAPAAPQAAGARPEICICCGRPLEPQAVRGLTFFAERRVVVGRGNEVRLAPILFSLFECLLEHYPGLRTQDAIYDDLYGARHEAMQPAPSVIRVQISKLREQLRPLGITVINEQGCGYRLAPFGGAA